MNTHRQTPLDREDIDQHTCSIDLRLKLLGRVPFFAPLAPAELAEVNELFREDGYRAEEYIYFTGDPATRLYVVAAGKIKLLRHSLEGKDVVLEVLGPGDLLGSLAALGDAEYADTAQAQTGVCVLGIAAEDFQRVLQRYPAVALKVLELTAARLQGAHDAIRQLSAEPVERRIAAALLKLAAKLGEQKPEGLLIQMPLSRQDIAAMTGATTETASRILSQFRKAGLIESGRQWISLKDPAALAALAGGQED